jgi:RNAse (barnase) inhibitor barstar
VRLSADVFRDTKASGVYLPVGASPSSKLESFAAGLGFSFDRVECRGISGKDDFLKATAAALHFPDYFGHNWDSLEDCLTDMSWLDAPGFVILLENLDGFARLSPRDFETALEILRDCTDYWADQGKPLLVFLSGNFDDTPDLTTVELPGP